MHTTTAGTNLAVLAAVFLLVFLPLQGRAQDAAEPSVQHAANAGAANIQAVPRRPSTPSVDVDDRIHQWVGDVRPLQDRLIQDDRLRGTVSVVGLGIATYQASRAHPSLPLGVIGTGALRIGFSHQLTLIRHESGYVVEPSIGRRSFPVRFRKALD
jgi:hypothetical protein